MQFASFCIFIKTSELLLHLSLSYTKPESHSFCVHTYLATKADSEPEIVELFRNWMQKLHYTTCKSRVLLFGKQLHGESSLSTK